MNLDIVILKVLVSNKKYALDFVNECDAKLFSPEVWNCAQIIINYIRTYKELPTLRVLTEKLSNEKQIENISKIWNQIVSTEYDDKEYVHDLEQLKKRFAEKQISALRDKLSSLDTGSVDVSRTVSEMQKTVRSIKNLTQNKTYERKTLKEAVPIFRDEYNAKMNDPGFDRGIKTGYSYFDDATDGLRPGELVLIGAESGGGKSMLLMNMAIQLWMQENTIDSTEFVPGNNILYFSLEMPFKPCLNRVLARLSHNPSKLIRNAKLNPEEAVKLKKALRFINRYPHQFEIVDIPRGATMENLEILYEEAKANYDPKIVIIDYLGLMEYQDSSGMDDWLKLGAISARIHEFCRVHNLIVLSAVQLTRSKGGKEIEDKIGMHRIGRSAMILHSANIAVQIETRSNERLYNDMFYHLIKVRDGALGRGKLLKDLACGTLIDEKLEEDQIEFYDRNPDDISGKLDDLDL